MYTTSGQITPKSVAGISKLANRLRLIPRRNTVEGEINYDHDIIYAEIDSALSHPCERASVVVVNDMNMTKQRKRREDEYERSKEEVLSSAGKGKVESSLAHRVRENTPAFTAPLQKWSEFGPEGYPLTPSFLIASGNFLDARLVAQPYSGAKLVG